MPFDEHERQVSTALDRHFTDTFEAFALKQDLWIAGLGVPSADTSLFSILDRATERKIVVAVSDANPSDARSAVDAVYDALRRGRAAHRVNAPRCCATPST